MGTLVFVCPTTGHEVSTGVEVDRSNYKRLSRTKTAVFCPRCRKNPFVSQEHDALRRLLAIVQISGSSPSAII